MKRWSKIVCNFVFAVALGAIANRFDIPIDFTIGENVRRPKQYDYEKGCSAAENAIKSIANSVSSKSFGCDIVCAADDIYKIAKQHEDDEKTLCTAIKELDSLMKKVRFQSDKAIISKFIKELATL